MAEETEDSEPSMDNILSSIREILSEDEGGAEPKGEKPQISASETNSIASSDQNIGVPADVDLSKQKPDAKITDTGNVQMTENISDVNAVEDSNLDTNSEDILELTQAMIAQPPPSIGAGDTILSTGASANSTDALQELAKALLNKRDIAIGNKDLTLEGLVREILRPLLREWLDQNLPYLIERLVKKEIDHMVNRAERLDI